MKYYKDGQRVFLKNEPELAKVLHSETEKRRRNKTKGVIEPIVERKIKLANGDEYIAQFNDYTTEALA